MTQQARNLAADDVPERFWLLIRDRDSKFTDAFDTAFGSDRARTILTPVRTPVANAYAERFVRTIRRECLDWILIRNERHLAHVVREYLEDDNRERPHRALGLRPPDPPPWPAAGPIKRRERLGDLIQQSERTAARARAEYGTLQEFSGIRKGEAFSPARPIFGQNGSGRGVRFDADVLPAEFRLDDLNSGA